MQKRKITSVVIAVLMIAAMLVPQSVVFADQTSETQKTDGVVQSTDDGRNTEENAADKTNAAADPAPANEENGDAGSLNGTDGTESTDSTPAEDSSQDVSWYDASKDSFTLKTAAELAGLAKLVNEGNTLEGKTVELANDIALAGEWTPIGTKDNAFAGTFNGNGKTISGLVITDAAGGYKGLFGYSKGTVKNFTIAGNIGSASAYITSGSDNIGGAVGYNDGTVSGITGNVNVYVKAGIYAVGGIVGQNGDGALVSKCVNNGAVTGTKHTGGVVGRNYEKIDRCVNNGTITGNGGSKDGIGGITGLAGNKNATYQSTVTNCYNTGTISNNNGRWHGGIVGMADKAATVTNCYDIGTIVKGYSWNWNPIIGHVDSYYSTVHDNYSLEGLNAGDSTASTQPNTIGTVKSESEFKSVDMIGLLGSAYTMDTDNINSGYPVLDWQASSTDVTGNITITKGGIYNIAEGTTGTITISTAELVTLVGPGSDKELKSLAINYTVAGANLRLSDIYLNNIGGAAANSINFTGTGNSLMTAGTVIIEHQPSGYSAKAAVHVPADGDLTISGSGTMYLYKSAAGAGIGGDSGETNGKITFNSGTFFIKGTKQSAAVGTGTNNTVLPGDITINGGNIYIIANSRGAAIGGAASSGGAVPGGNVYVNGGTLSINCDWSGAAIGGGGYSAGNDSDGGNLYVSAGSIRTYIDENAKSNFGVDTAGVNDKAITAKKMNNSTDQSEVALLTFDTSKLGDQTAASFTVIEGSSTIYSGGLHEYSFVNESAVKDDQKTVDKITDNWEKSTDKNLYLYLTKENHTLTVNGQTFNVTYDADAKAFSYEWAGTEVITLIDEIGTVDGTDACKAKIDKAQAAYNALSSTDKKYVTNAKTLTNAANQYAALKVDEKIDAIGTVTLEKESAITDARAAYKALSYTQKQLVTKLTTLEEAEATLAALKADKAAADAVIAKIDAIDDPVTLESKAGIDAARTAYDALTADQQKLVTNIDKLTEAEKTYEALKKAADEKAAADKAAAQGVSDMIAKISDEVTLKDKDAVEDAAAAYDKLTDDQKALITDAEKTKLENAETKLEELMAPINDVIEMIKNLPVSLTDSDEDIYSVLLAEEAFNALTDEEKAVVPEAYTDTLDLAIEKLIDINSTSGDVHADGLDEYTRIIAEPVTSGDDYDAMKEYNTSKSLRAMYNIKFVRYAVIDKELVKTELAELEEPVKLTITNDAFSGYESPAGVFKTDDAYKQINVVFNGNAATVSAAGSGDLGIFADKTAVPDSKAKTGDSFALLPAAAVMIAAAAAAAALLAVRRRKKEM